MEDFISTDSILKQKLKSNEEIITTLDCYQIESSEHQNRLLAIIKNVLNGSHAIFSFSLLNNPCLTISDLAINSVFAIDATFFIDTFVTATTVSSNQFQLLSGETESTFFYYPLESTLLAKDKFNSIVKKIIQECPDNQDFSWLDFYRRPDMSEISEAVASGRESIKSRDSKFKEELDRRKPEYMTVEPYKIFCGTWNVNEKPYHDGLDLSKWLRAGSIEPPDIFAIGFQEINMSPDTILLSETRPDPGWIESIMRGLPKEDKYYQVASVRLVGMMLTIMSKESLKHNIKRVSQSNCGTGTMKFGNKGAVGVSLQLNETFICFVNAHLAAHVQEFERRNEDHDEILRRLQFSEGIRTRSIEEHDQIYWVGDLNYRLQNLSEGQVKTFLDYERLMYHDQLYIERNKKRVFEGYSEGKITFKPTYKYDPGTDDWDSSEKCRAPAWCDRIFWKTSRLRVEQLCYNSVMEIRDSDHKPVYAVFIAFITTRDENKFKRVHEEVLKTVDKYENDNQPQIFVPETDMNFGIIQFNEKLSRDLTIANNCHLPVEFKFKPKDDNAKTICEDWIQISHKKYKLLTGESMSIRIDICIDEKTVAKVTNRIKQSGGNSKELLDILVLHVENGRDIFITIFGEFKPSVFGFHFETLMKLSKPLNEYDLPELMAIDCDLENSISYYNEKLVPRELWLLIDYLYQHGLQKRDLFSLNRKFKSNPKCNEIRDWLDSWSTEEFPGNPYLAAEVLLKLLESSPLPIVTITERELSIYSAYFDKCKELLHNKMPILKRKIFWYVCMFLKELQKNYPSNMMDDRLLATIFSRALCRQSNEQYQQRFLLNFLTNDIKALAKSDFDRKL